MSKLKDQGCWLIGTCLGLGLAPIAPGSFGALLGVVYYVVVAWFAPVAWHGWLLAAGLVLSTWATIALGPWAERYFRVKDSKNFVTDEVVGYLFTVLLYRTENIWATAIIGFFVARIVDIAKIPPARRLEKLPAGWGVVADDLLGSVYAALLLHLARWMWPDLLGHAPQWLF
ncbi:MAG: phosphatidylglycerophosphatase A [Planctomycetales bacterium]|nr:phosphatidylglycerophosphatase A [Planctomycetales bacterium]